MYRETALPFGETKESLRRKCIGLGCYWKWDGQAGKKDSQKQRREV